MSAFLGASVSPSVSEVSDFFGASPKYNFFSGRRLRLVLYLSWYSFANENFRGAPNIQWVTIADKSFDPAGFEIFS